MLSNIFRQIHTKIRGGVALEGRFFVFSAALSWSRNNGCNAWTCKRLIFLFAFVFILLRFLHFNILANIFQLNLKSCFHWVEMYNLPLNSWEKIHLRQFFSSIVSTFHVVITWIYVSPNQHFRPPKGHFGGTFPPPPRFFTSKKMWDEFRAELKTNWRSWLHKDWIDQWLGQHLHSSDLTVHYLGCTLDDFLRRFGVFFLMGFFGSWIWLVSFPFTKMRWLILGSYFGFVSGTKMTFCWKVFIEFFPLWMDTFLQRFLIGNLGKMFSHRYESTITDGCRQKQAVPPK